MGPKVFLEYSSKELIELAKKDTPKRYERRLELGPTKVSSVSLDYKTGNAVILLTTHNHEQHVEIENFIDLVAAEIIEKHADGIRREDLMRIVNVAIRLLLEEGDILVDCDCEDYQYRFNWIAKQYGFALLDRIRGYDYAPDQSNPRYAGGICKHITKVLTRESQWAEMAQRRLINEILKYKEFNNIPILPDNSVPEEEIIEEPIVEEPEIAEEIPEEQEDLDVNLDDLDEVPPEEEEETEDKNVNIDEDKPSIGNI